MYGNVLQFAPFSSSRAQRHYQGNHTYIYLSPPIKVLIRYLDDPPSGGSLGRGPASAACRASSGRQGKLKGVLGFHEEALVFLECVYVCVCACFQTFFQGCKVYYY